MYYHMVSIGQMFSRSLSGFSDSESHQDKTQVASRTMEKNFACKSSEDAGVIHFLAIIILKVFFFLSTEGHSQPLMVPCYMALSTGPLTIW